MHASVTPLARVLLRSIFGGVRLGLGESTAEPQASPSVYFLHPVPGNEWLVHLGPVSVSHDLNSEAQFRPRSLVCNI